MPTATATQRYEVVSSGSTVWINSAEGCCIGRFSKFGLDVHLDAYAQMTSGRECLDCIPGLPDLAGWERFKRSMLQHHDAIVDDLHKPEWL